MVCGYSDCGFDFLFHNLQYTALQQSPLHYKILKIQLDLPNTDHKCNNAYYLEFGLLI